MQQNYIDVRRASISVGDARRILSRNGNFYTDTKIEAILDYLYQLVEIELSFQGKYINKDKELHRRYILLFFNALTRYY